MLDHLGKPPVRDGWGSPAADAWLTTIRALADEPRKSVKLSGMAPELDPIRPLDQTRPFLEAALEAFGKDRSTAGGDFPFSSVGPGRVDYATWFEWVGSLLGADPDRDAVLRTTALRVYTAR